MKKFLVKRIGYMLITLVIIITATFYMMHSIPGDPLAHMARNLPDVYKRQGHSRKTTPKHSSKEGRR